MKMMNRISCILLVLVMVLAMSVNVFATDVDGSVTYEGKAKEFIFAPGSQYSPTDLFTNFKGVMPGDTLTEQIVVKNAKSTGVKVKIYMRSLGAQLDSDEFLPQMTLTVKQNGQAKLFEAPADQTAQLTEWTLLGTLSAGGEATLDVELNVPITMGNEFADEIGYLDWQFKVEEIPETPKTGDTSNLVFYGGIAILSLALIAVILVMNKRKKTA